jgi:hypothetical protein
MKARRRIAAPKGSGPVPTMLWYEAITSGICGRSAACQPAAARAPCAATPLYKTAIPFGGMGFRERFAPRQSRAADVRFGSKADVHPAWGVVRFTPNSGHRNSVVECPLCANSGHSPESLR